MINSEIKIKLNNFDGPLGLLLLLVQNEDIPLEKLDLTSITKQYIDYLTKMREINFDIAGDYLIMAATLIFLKSKYGIRDEALDDLLADSSAIPDSGIQTKADLIRKLEELKRFQNLGKKLWDLPKHGHETFLKPKVDRKSIINSILTPIDLTSLTDTMMQLLEREGRKYKSIAKDKFSIKEKMNFLKEKLKQGDSKDFDELLNPNPLNQDKIGEIIITFISLLELSRLKKVQLFQNCEKSTIYIKVVESLDNLNIELVDGFKPQENGVLQ